MNRSKLNERDRMTNLISQVPESMREAVIARAQNRANQRVTGKADNSIWRDGVEPMPFDEFCVALDGQPMFDKQGEVFELAELLRASSILSPDRTITEFILVWGKRCVAGETRIRDEATGEVRTAEEWRDRGCELTVKSWDGEKVVLARTSPVYCKGRANLYRVTLSDGREFRTTGAHRVMTDQGWCQIGDLVAGQRLLSLPPSSDQTLCSAPYRKGMVVPNEHVSPHSAHRSSIEELGLATSALANGIPACHDSLSPDYTGSHEVLPVCGEPDCHTDVGSPGDCRPLYHSGDEPPHPVANSARLSALLPVGVREHNHENWHKGDPDTEQAHSRTYPPCAHHSDDVFLPAYHVVGGQRYSLSSDGELSPVVCQTSAPALPESPLPHTEQQSERSGQQKYYDSFVYPPACYDAIVTGVSQEEEADFYDLTVEGTGCYFDANGILHHNSGKDYLTSKLICYYAFILHHLKEKPQVYMSRTGGKKIAPDTQMNVVNVAPNEDLASQVFFQYMKQFLSSPLFEDIAMRPAPPQWTLGTKTIVFPEINLHLYSKTSKSSGLDGYNVLMWILDEGDAFLDNAEKSNAKEIHDIFRRTSSTTFGPFSMGVCISYPRYEEGFMLRLKRRAEDANAIEIAAGRPPLFFVHMGATHEMRPDFSLDDPTVQEEFRDDPQGASAMYLCLPMSAEEAFIEFPERIAQAVDTERRPLVEHITTVLDQSSQKNGSGWRVVVALSDLPAPEPGRAYFIGTDAGKTGDSYALAVYSILNGGQYAKWFCPKCGVPELRMNLPYVQMPPGTAVDPDALCRICVYKPEELRHFDPMLGWWKLELNAFGEVTIGANRLQLPIVREEVLIEIRPQHKKRIEEVNATVDFIAAADVTETLIKELHIQYVGFDAWQMAYTGQRLQSNTSAQILEMKMQGADQYRRARLYKAMLYQSLIRNLPNEKRDREWKRLKKKGIGVDHPDGVGESKDLADAEMIAVWLAVTSVNEEIAVLL